MTSATTVQICEWPEGKPRYAADRSHNSVAHLECKPGDLVPSIGDVIELSGLAYEVIGRTHVALTDAATDTTTLLSSRLLVRRIDSGDER